MADKHAGSVDGQCGYVRVERLLLRVIEVGFDVGDEVGFGGLTNAGELRDADRSRSNVPLFVGILLELVPKLGADGFR